MYKRIIITSDWHFGIRSNNLDWFEIMKDYHESFFIPWLEENVQEGDVMYHLGDVFDNRQNVNLLIASYAIDLFERLSRIVPIHIIVGNHDIYRKNTNEVTSVDILKHIPNITIHKEPIVHKYKEAKCLLMPWRRDKEHEQETLAEYKNVDYLFCHSEVKGVRTTSNPHVKLEEGNDVNLFKRFKRVYSGHIHYAQRFSNVNFVGNPHHMTRSDRGNKKGIWLLDMETGTESFYENTRSPIFLKYKMSSILDETVETLQEKFSNNFIDLQVSSKFITSCNISTLINLLESHARKIELDIQEEENLDVEGFEIDENVSGEFDILNISKTYIDSTSYDEELKERLLKSIKSLYLKVNED
jgi:DNA repair exonuclease SbcCD nuclease subunit